MKQDVKTQTNLDAKFIFTRATRKITWNDGNEWPNAKKTTKIT